ncbi:MAG: chromosomal replication initiator protein DnaA [candidate division KSB1 bacterium]|nr:chromosomal replication initiator protein DnaA [candidate division KSB1 bacterium]
MVPLTQLDEPSAIWDRCLQLIRPSVNEQAFHTWFRPIRAKSIDTSGAVLQVPNRFFLDYVDQHYRPLIAAALSQILGSAVPIYYEVLSPDAPIPPTPVLLPSPPRDGIDAETQLSLRFTFDNFVEGSNNQFARAAALAVAQSPGRTAFNPLVIYGGVGLGKTHLLQAIGNHIRSQGNHCRVLYVSSERFTLDFISAIQNNRAAEFSARYRSVDVLLLDDIQFFANKERTQEEFFHTFNALYHRGKQIVLTSDRPPGELKGVEERLISRFNSGLVADIQPPDYETRLAILTKKAEENGIDLDPAIYDFLAAHVTSNIRELEGSLIRLLAYSSLTGQDITLRMAKEVLRDIIRPKQRRLSIELIQSIVAEHYGIPDDLLRARTRKQEIAHARQVAMYIVKKLTNAPLKTIGLHFGGRDHTTVVHAIQTIESALERDDSLRQDLEDIERKIEIATL